MGQVAEMKRFVMDAIEKENLKAAYSIYKFSNKKKISDSKKESCQTQFGTN